jgi:hypothetical protein
MLEVKIDIDLRTNIIKTLAYFDIFHYPLTLTEIIQFLNYKVTSVEIVREHLQYLVDSQIIHRYSNFYSLRDDQALSKKRSEANREADKWMPIAQKKAKLIFRFPFVRAVMASGSLSKHCMDENSDLDFFVVTAKNRLWITRFLLTIYKKVFLRNRHKYFCINYYIDESHLDIHDENLFIATELITLIPMQGNPCYSALQQSNARWISRFFPNFRPIAFTSQQNESSPLKILLEKMMSVIPSDVIENAVMKITHRRWRKLYERTLGPEEFNQAFRSTPYVSKAHPQNFRKKVLDRYDEQLRQYGNKLKMY